MRDLSAELEEFREEVAALRKEIERLKDRVFPGYPVAAPAGPIVPCMWPVQPLPMPPYPFHPYFGPNTADASGVGRYPTSAADPTPGPIVDAVTLRKIVGDPAASFAGHAGDGGTKV